MSENEKQDALDRKIAAGERWFDKLFAAVQKDPKGTILVLFIMYSVLITYLYISNIKTSSEEMLAEVRRTATIVAKAEVSVQMQPIKQEQKEQGKRADTTLTKFDETVQKFKEKYLPNTEK